MNKSILAGAAFLASVALAVPILASAADPAPTAPAAMPDRALPPQGMERHHDGDHRMGMRSPQQRCEARIARRAAQVAYVASMLNLTAEQRPLYAKVEAAMQGASDKEHQLCAGLPTEAGAGMQATVLDRLNRREQFLQARLAGMQQVQPALQSLYQSLTPAQKAIIDHPFHRG